MPTTSVSSLRLPSTCADAVLTGQGDLEQRLSLNKEYNLSIVMGHYPLSLVDDHETRSSGRGFRQVFEMYPPALYVCGHLHDAFGKALYRRHSDGIHEAELTDFKYNSRYRLRNRALDHAC